MNKEFLQDNPGLKLSAAILIMIYQMIENLKHQFEHLIRVHLIEAGIAVIPLVKPMRYAKSKQRFFKRGMADRKADSISAWKLPLPSKYSTQCIRFLICVISHINKGLGKILGAAKNGFALSYPAIILFIKTQLSLHYLLQSKLYTKYLHV
jgi:hypothetical protein